MPDDKSQGIVRTGRGEEQPADKERAQNAIKTEQGHMPAQPVIKKPEGKSEPTDDRRGAYEPVTKDGLPWRPHVKDTIIPSQKAQ
jgi:hypothetical protein